MAANVPRAMDWLLRAGLVPHLIFVKGEAPPP
jgi:hypothetical protein